MKRDGVESARSRPLVLLDQAGWHVSKKLKGTPTTESLESAWTELSGAAIESLIRPNTSVIFIEIPGSQSFEIQDVPAIAALARSKGICTILDNTWATPLFFPPHARGVDMLIGLVSANAEWFPRLRATFDAFAMCAGPEDVFLSLRGLRTLDLRLREAEHQALDLACWLAARKEIVQALHPALPSCPGHAFWKRDFLGSSGLFSVLLSPCSRAALAAMLDGLKLFGMGYSWGGFESLVIPFDCRSYRVESARSRLALFRRPPLEPCLRLPASLRSPSPF
jgi:cysteine-S-conjugate beta-lyase